VVVGVAEGDCEGQFGEEEFWRECGEGKRV
jgi:hypothetical protein